MRAIIDVQVWRDGLRGSSCFRQAGFMVAPTIVWVACISEASAQELLCQKFGPESFGTAVAEGEDLDGDGRDEFLVGAPETFYLGMRTGSVRVFSAECQQRLHVGGFTDEEEFGSAVAMLSDIDGDGLGDYAVAAPRADVAGQDSGRVSVFSGRSGALLYIGIRARGGRSLRHLARTRGRRRWRRLGGLDRRRTVRGSAGDEQRRGGGGLGTRRQALPSLRRW